MKIQKGLTRTEENVLKINNNSLVQILRAAASQIPIVGGIDSLYSDFVKEIEEKNFIIYIRALIDKNILERIDQLKETEEWNVLLEHGAIKSFRCSKNGQIHKIVDILKGKLDGEIESFNDAEDLINIISELSESEGKCLFEAYRNLRNNNLLKNNGEDIKNIPVDQREFLLIRLVGKGLLKIDPASQPVSGCVTDFSPTNMGKKLFSTLSQL